MPPKPDPSPPAQSFQRFDRPTPVAETLAMTIALAPDVEDFLQEQVRAGVCTDVSELVNDVIRSVRDQRQKQFEVTPELEAWLMEAAGRPLTPLMAQDFAAIRERVRIRTQSTTQ